MPAHPPMAIAALASASSAMLRVLALIITAVISGASTTAIAAENPLVLLRTSMGDIVLELNQERAPTTVRNFLQYVDDGFYSDTLFHRVIEGFMIQGGGFASDYTRKHTRAAISNEAYNGLSNQRYTISMARRAAPHSATSQFFINSADNTNLDHTTTSDTGWGYTVFGRVIQGEQIVDNISQLPTSAGGPFGRDVPRTPVIIENVERLIEQAVGKPTVTETGDLDKPASAMPKVQ